MNTFPRLQKLPAHQCFTCELNGTNRLTLETLFENPKDVYMLLKSKEDFISYPHDENTMKVAKGYCIEHVEDAIREHYNELFPSVKNKEENIGRMMNGI